MRNDKTTYSQGEIRALIAPLIGLQPEDVEEYAVVAVTKCDDCGGHDMSAVVCSTDDPMQAIRILSDGIQAQLARNE